MPRWARTLVLLVGMLGWVAMIGVSLFGLKEIPGAMLIGFPAALWLTLAGRPKVNDESGQQGGAPAVAAATTERESDIS